MKNVSYHRSFENTNTYKNFIGKTGTSKNGNHFLGFNGDLQVILLKFPSKKGLSIYLEQQIGDNK